MCVGILTQRSLLDRIVEEKYNKNRGDNGIVDLLRKFISSIKKVEVVVSKPRQVFRSPTKERVPGSGSLSREGYSRGLTLDPGPQDSGRPWETQGTGPMGDFSSTSSFLGTRP